MMGKTVLVVDDSKIARMMTCAIVSKLQPGWRITQAANGAEALEAASAQPFDFVLLDVNMPGIDGIETAKLLKEQSPKAAITLLTANIQDATRRQAAEIGIGFLPKPVREEQIADFLAGRQPQ